MVNDCFFYFLKNSEPLYAYHALRMAEGYCRKHLFATEEMNECNLQSVSFCFNHVNDMYDYQKDKEYLQKSTAEKLEITYDFSERLPSLLSKGSGSSWRF